MLSNEIQRTQEKAIKQLAEVLPYAYNRHAEIETLTKSIVALTFALQERNAR